MARVTHVKKAQQRYATKPVIDPETGEQKKVPVLRKDGTQKTTKGGRPVFLRITERDLTQPKPLFKCDSCGEDIQLGTPYKWVQPHGSYQRNRHAGCPTWQPWELSNSLSARIAQIQDGDPDGVESVEDVEAWRDEKVELIRELASEKEESSQNIEDGFGHETEQSNELRDIAEQLNSWADELEAVDLPDFPEAGEDDCGECGGTGQVEVDNPEEDDDTCGECGGSGELTPDDPTDEQVAEWSEEAIQAVRDLLDQAPV